MSYFPTDIPFMSEEELKENGIKVNCSEKPNNSKLKPCPFCGSMPRFWHWNYGAIVECWRTDHRVQCEAKTLDEAKEAWNRRTNADNNRENKK